MPAIILTAYDCIILLMQSLRTSIAITPKHNVAKLEPIG